MEEVTSGIEDIEAEAEKILESARKRANEIFLEAKKETGRILSSDLPMDGVKAECQEIVRKSREEADNKIDDARKKASHIRDDASSKVAKIADRIVSIVTGTGSR